MNPRSTSGTGIRLRDRLRAETRDAILRAAEQALVEGGVEATRMESIAARAGVAVGTLYNHFDSRDALLGALVEAHRAALLRRLDAACAGNGERPFDEDLTRLLRAFFAHAAEYRGLLGRLVQGDGVGLADRGKGTLLDAITERVEAVLRRGRAAGRLQPDPGGLQAFLLVGMLRGALRWHASRTGGAGPGAEARADRVRAAFLEGVGV